MKKILIVLILLFLIGCKSTNKLTFDKQSLQDLSFNVAFVPTKVEITQNEFLFEPIWQYENKTLIIEPGELLCLIAGVYHISISNDDDEITYELEVTGMKTNIPTLNKESLFFDVDRYYVLCTKASCPACEWVMVSSYQYYDLSTSISMNHLPPIYLLDYEGNENLFGPNVQVLGVKTIDNLQIPSFPSLLVFENGEIVGYYHGTTQVNDFFSSLLA
jgi:hypothetical protein